MIVLRNKYFSPEKVKSFEALAKQLYKKTPKEKVILKSDPRWVWTTF